MNKNTYDKFIEKNPEQKDPMEKECKQLLKRENTRQKSNQELRELCNDIIKEYDQKHKYLSDDDFMVLTLNFAADLMVNIYRFHRKMLKIGKYKKIETPEQFCNRMGCVTFDHLTSALEERKLKKADEI